MSGRAHRRQLGVTLGLLLLASCADKPATYDDVAPILARSCTHCHKPAGIAPFSLETYDDAAPIAGILAAEVASGHMPPWNAVRDLDCRVPLPFVADESLSDAERETLASWAERGAPPGSPGVTAISTRAPVVLDTWNLTVAMPAAFSPPAGVDTFRCFVIDPQLATDRHVTAVDFVPGNRSLVHHASLLIDPTRSLADKLGPDGYDCLTEGTTAPLHEINPWTPGVGADIYPSDIARVIPAGSLFLIEIHYANHADSPTLPDVPDLSEFHLQTTDAPPAYALTDWMYGGATLPGDAPPRLLPGPNDRSQVEFFIPRGAVDHTESMQLSIPAASTGRIYAVQAHAHFGATEIRADLVRPDGDRICLLKDRWNFNWQRRYTYDAPFDRLLTLSPADRLDVRCTYNNSMTNLALYAYRRSLGLDLADLSYGGRSTDEMCHVMLHVLTGSD